MPDVTRSDSQLARERASVKCKDDDIRTRVRGLAIECDLEMSRAAVDEDSRRRARYLGARDALIEVLTALDG